VIEDMEPVQRHTIEEEDEFMQHSDLSDEDAALSDS
jgi:hypothetical protein